MPILARFLMLVACVPLLQPTGFCICKVGDRECIISHQEPVAAHNYSLTTSQKTGCCSHRHASDSADGATASESCPPARHPCPVPGDDHHLPGCPASVGVDQFKWVETAESLFQVLPLAEVTALVPVDATDFSAPCTTTSTKRHSPPIYLSHCSLVI